VTRKAGKVKKTLEYILKTEKLLTRQKIFPLSGKVVDMHVVSIWEINIMIPVTEISPAAEQARSRSV
jgi:hypothetical protein